MTTMEHSVAPEDVMALLDGELAAAEAQAVSAHLEQCDQCARLAEELRGTSRSLARWSVPAVPDELEDSVMDMAAAGGRKIAGPRGWFRGGFWNRRLMLSGGAVAMVLLVLTIFISPRLNRPSPVGEALVIANGNLQPRFEDKRRTFYSRTPRPSGGIAGMAGANQLLQAPTAGVDAKAEKEDGPPVQANSSFFAKAESANVVMGGVLQAPAPMIAMGRGWVGLGQACVRLVTFDELIFFSVLK